MLNVKELLEGSVFINSAVYGICMSATSNQNDNTIFNVYVQNSAK